MGCAHWGWHRSLHPHARRPAHVQRQSSSEAPCFGKEWADGEAPLHCGESRTERKPAQRSQLACPERSQVADQPPQPHWSRFATLQAASASTSSHAASKASGAHRPRGLRSEPVPWDPNCHAAERLELAPTVWSEPVRAKAQRT
jgi:hypothetical protein